MGIEKKGLALVLLASGFSRRFNGNKLLHEINGKPMYHHITDEVKKLPETVFQQKIVVTQYESLGNDCREKGYTVIMNEDSHLGISHSIHLALEAAYTWGCCFAVCDQPYLKSKTLESFVLGWEKSKKGLGCLSWEGKLGNPTIFSRTYFNELKELEGDFGGKKVIINHRDDLYIHQVNHKIELDDVDERPDIV